MSDQTINGLGKGFFVIGIIVCMASFAGVTLEPLPTKQEMFNAGLFMMMLGLGILVLLITRE